MRQIDDMYRWLCPIDWLLHLHQEKVYLGSLESTRCALHWDELLGFGIPFLLFFFHRDDDRYGNIDLGNSNRLHGRRLSRGHLWRGLRHGWGRSGTALRTSDKKKKYSHNTKRADTVSRHIIISVQKQSTEKKKSGGKKRKKLYLKALKLKLIIAKWQTRRPST